MADARHTSSELASPLAGSYEGGAMIVGRRQGDSENGWLIELQCGHEDIGGDVCYARVLVVDEPVSFPDVPPRVFLPFAPTGFRKGEDGVWRQIEHARKNRSHGRPEAYRRPWRGAAYRGVYAVRQVEYPYMVQCPWCRERHMIENEDALRRLVDK